MNPVLRRIYREQREQSAALLRARYRHNMGPVVKPALRESRDGATSRAPGLTPPSSGRAAEVVRASARPAPRALALVAP